MKFALQASPNLVKLDHGKLNTGCSWQENQICLLKTGIFDLWAGCGVFNTAKWALWWQKSPVDCRFLVIHQQKQSNKTWCYMIQMPIVLTPADYLYINGIVCLFSGS
jgi:hypothetical protein